MNLFKKKNANNSTDSTDSTDSAIAKLAEYFLTDEHIQHSQADTIKILSTILPNIPLLLRHLRDCLNKDINNKNKQTHFFYFVQHMEIFLLFNWPASESEPYTEMLSAQLELLDSVAVSVRGGTLRFMSNCIGCFGKRAIEPLFTKMKHSDPKIVSAALICTKRIWQKSLSDGSIDELKLKMDELALVAKSICEKEPERLGGIPAKFQGKPNESWSIWHNTCSKLIDDADYLFMT